MTLLRIVAVTAIFINGLSDLKTRETFTFLSLIPLILSLFLLPAKLPSLLAIIIILFSRDTKFAGGGDIDAFVILLFSFGLSRTVAIYTIATMLAVGWWIRGKVRKEERIINQRGASHKERTAEQEKPVEPGSFIADNEKSNILETQREKFLYEGVPFVAMLGAASVWFLALTM